MLTFLNDNSFKNKSEKGRSLIEIIAILVILAILLIAALIGFKALLDYLKKRETSSQISTIGMRYKTDRLGKVRKSTGKVSLKELYPEGTPCSVNDSTCVKTPDGGQIELYSYEDTTSFVVVARNVQFLSCEEAILAGGYTKARFFSNDNNPDHFLEAGTILTNSSEIYGESKSNSPQYFDASYFRQHPEELREKCNLNFALIYTGHHGDCKNFYNGKCHDCPKGQEKDNREVCCPSGKIICGVCGGCDGDTPYCKDNICVECTNHDECISKYQQKKPWCDSRDGTCKSCKNIGDPCTDSSGTEIGGMYCNENLECEELCEGKDRWIPNPLNPKQCICDNKTNLPKGATCDVTTDVTCQDTCATALECKAGSCQCKDNPDEEGSTCSADCPCDTKLECRNGHCINPKNETMCTNQPPNGLGLKPTENRNKGEKCSYAPNCPCNSAAKELLECKDSSCKCASLPKKDKECWGECGCEKGLECSTAGKAEMGKCRCPSKLPDTRDADCHPDCGCGDGLKCDPTSWKCICDPPKNAKTLVAGKPCAGEDQCPKQCKDTECRSDGNSGHKTCCSAPQGCSDEAEFDNDGCLKYNVNACPPQGDNKKTVCDTSDHVCVECLQHTHCADGYYCSGKTCVPCGDKARCLNNKNPIPKDVFERCKYNCQNNQNEPDKKFCSTKDNKTCVGCNSDEDCTGDTYCDLSEQVCKKCPPVDPCDATQKCCRQDGQDWQASYPQKCRNSKHYTAKNYTTSVTYYKMVNGVCTAQTVSYCPLTAKAPVSTCTPCEGHYCGKTCCSRSTPCGLKANTCCEAYTFADGVVNLHNETKSFYVNSEDDMQFNVNIHGLTRFGKIKVCEGSDCTVYKSNDLDVSIKTSSGQYGEITRTLPLKSGKTYKITLDYNNKCGSCSVTATCQ